MAYRFAGAGAGGGASIVQRQSAGVASTLPAASVARTSKTCSPGARPLYAAGELHAAHVAPSRRQANVAPDSLAENANDALVACVGVAGPVAIVVSGGVVSAGAGAATVNACVAGVGSAAPVGPVAKAWKV